MLWTIWTKLIRLAALAVINLLETQGVVQVLSSPRIATVNNQKAVIKVGDDEFFVTDITTNTVTAGAAINVNDSPTAR